MVSSMLFPSLDNFDVTFLIETPSFPEIPRGMIKETGEISSSLKVIVTMVFPVESSYVVITLDICVPPVLKKVHDAKGEERVKATKSKLSLVNKFFFIFLPPANVSLTLQWKELDQIR